MASSVFDEMVQQLDNNTKGPDPEKKKKDKKGDPNKKSGTGEEDASKSSSKAPKSSKPEKDSTSASTSASTSQPSLDIGNLILKGFKNLQKSMENMGENMAEKVAQSLENRFDNFDIPEEEEMELGELEETEEAESANEQDELFQTMIDGFETEGKLGKNVNDGLAKLCNKFLSNKMSKELEKEKSDGYARPKNVEFAEAPMTNKPIFETLRYSTKYLDVGLQTVQKDFLKGTLPVIEVMEELAKNESAENMDVKNMIKKLADSVAFIGAANVNMVKTRRHLIKRDLPPRMKGLCRDGEEFSGKLLFGDNLNGKIKEVSELNKVTNDFKRGSFRGRGFRGMGRGGFRGSRGKRFPRFNPYYRNMSNKRADKTSGNKKSPSSA